MPLLVFSLSDGLRRLGVQSQETIHDVSQVFGVSDVATFLRRGLEVLDIENLRLASEPIDPADVVIHAPMHQPGKIICVGLNYHDHCREQSIDPPPYPILFSKFANAVADPNGTVTRPIATEMLDLECELAVVIGRRASRIGREQARDVIFGYTILNDITMRDLQLEDRQWLRAKSSDGFAPMGPVVVTADEVEDPHALRLRSSVNGETWQDSTTAEMIDVATVVAFVSRTITLEPGDVIATGTPAGVGHYQDPPRYLVGGDRLRCEIDGIGALDSVVVDEEPRADDHAAAAGVA
ncbi:MAG: fumarylacetoacetate hydrolase family protein [Chloroflexi bacterium]|nr:fumarylacetoacetate hydrolase family protein [Chloroflexota bacterium]